MENRSALSTVLRNWKSVVGLGLAGLVVGLALSFLQTPTYQSQSQVFLTFNAADTTGEISQTSTYAADQAKNYAGVATSDAVLQPTIDQLGLGTTPSKLAEKVRASVPVDTSAITIDVTDNDPGAAARIANAIATHLTELVADTTPKVKGQNPVRMEQVDKAVPATSASGPSRPLYAVCGLVLGMLAGTALALARATRRTGASRAPQAAVER